MNKNFLLALLLSGSFLLSCVNNTSKDTEVKVKIEETEQTSNTFVESFADIQILRYEVPGWEELSLKEQKLVYYLTQAGIQGRDIIWDQNYRHNLAIRHALENIYTQFDGDKTTKDWEHFETYLKRVWFSNGIHHHYSTSKIKPAFTKDYFNNLLESTHTELDADIVAILFNDVDDKRTNLSKDVDIVLHSAVNYYGPDVTDAEATAFYDSMYADPLRPIEKGLNSKLVKEDGKLVEKVWKSGGMYGEAIDKIIYWLEKAVGVAENQEQVTALNLLIEYYKTGDLKTWDDYAIAWLKAEGNIDWHSGFIEVYNDPKGHKGAYESIVQIKDFDMSAKMDVLSQEAQWFEDNSPLQEEHKKENVVGVSYKTVVVASEAGDSSPSTPIGVNLPNNNWIRQEYGSKSVSLGNIIEAYNQASGSDRIKEFAYTPEEVELSIKYGQLASNLHTALHEVVGHASGQINEGVGTPRETLRSYASTIEEGRADLFGLYYLYSPKLEELGLVDDWEKVGKTAYNNYIRNGLMLQLVRINLGDDIEQTHMRNRQWVSSIVYERGKKDNVIEKIVENGKTYFVINDYDKLRELFGDLLRQTQRITSEGDFEAAKEIVETYGVKVDQEIHKEVLERNAQFATPPYSGFVNPEITPIKNEEGEITGFELVQPKDFAEQMLKYAKNYSNLPLVN